ncbi:putative ATP-grasp target RiPP [Allonocardiopsis opalescens]|uniref:Putative ATP-grasp target RiPP n=2 Tax=Allonocardiopsis opalescens TaxID=1144618 RepID=A0A2T0Q9Z9_9ACTN|nr:putative ATP-grasp target RiPP [Allonocardiopsis opalescens]
MRPFPAAAPVCYARIELDPETQTARCLDAAGQVIEAGKHGTNVRQDTHTETHAGPDGANPGSPRTDTSVDYGPD